MFLQQLVTDISIDSVYALSAVGYALIFNVFNFPNFGFGPVMMLRTFAAFYAIPISDLPLFPPILLVMVVADIVSFIMELTVHRPMRQRKALKLYLMTVRLGINTLVPNAMIQIFDGGVHAFPSDWVCVTIQMGGVVVLRPDIPAAVLFILMLVGFRMFLYNTRAGLGARISSFDTNIASLMGINVNSVAMIILLLSGAAAGPAGCFYGMKYSVFPSMGAITNKGFMAVTIGDLGSLIGVVISDLLLGLLEVMVASYMSSTRRDLIAYTMLIIISIFTSNGILGKGMHGKI